MSREPIPVDVMTAFLLKVEGTIHRGGWDQAAFVAALDQLAPGVVVAKPVPIPIEGESGVYIEQVGYLMDRDPTGAKLLLASHQNLIGVIFVCEGWQQEMTDAERQQENRSFADIPGSKEVRVISAVDLWGRSFAVQRARGAKPEILQGNGEQLLIGRVYNGLAMMMRATVRQMDDAVELEPALAATVEAIHQAHQEMA